MGNFKDFRRMTDHIFIESKSGYVGSTLSRRWIICKNCGSEWFTYVKLEHVNSDPKSVGVTDNCEEFIIRRILND